MILKQGVAIAMLLASLPVVTTAAVKLNGWVDNYSLNDGEYEFSTIVKLDLSALKAKDMDQYLSTQVDIYGDFVKKENGDYEFKASKIVVPKDTAEEH